MSVCGVIGTLFGLLLYLLIDDVIEHTLFIRIPSYTDLNGEVRLIASGEEMRSILMSVPTNDSGFFIFDARPLAAKSKILAVKLRTRKENLLDQDYELVSKVLNKAFSVDLMGFIDAARLSLVQLEKDMEVWRKSISQNGPNEIAVKALSKNTARYTQLNMALGLIEKEGSQFVRIKPFDAEPKIVFPRLNLSLLLGFAMGIALGGAVILLNAKRN